MHDAVQVFLFLLVAALFIALLIVGTVMLSRTADLKTRLDSLARELEGLRKKVREQVPAESPAMEAPPVPEAPPLPAAPPAASPPPVPAFAASASQPSPAATPPPVRRPETAPPGPPPLPAGARPPLPKRPAVNVEAFLGRNLFAWIGGIALFFGLALFLQYSFKNNLISPGVRVALGYLFGAAMLMVGLRLPRPRYEIGVHTLVSAGLLAFCASTWAAHALHQFIGQPLAFALLALTSAAGFALSIRLKSQAVALLGLLAGFLTPILVSTGSDRTLALFLYIGVLNAGIVAVVLRCPHWPHLLSLGWLGTTLIQVGWLIRYAEKHPVWHGYLIFCSFTALFCGACWVLERWLPAEGAEKRRPWAFVAALGSAGMAYLYGLLSLGAGEARAAGPPVFLGYVFAVDVLVLAAAWYLGRVWRFAPVASVLAAVLLLAGWMGTRLQESQLGWALGATVLFAALHTAYHIAFERRHGNARPGALSHLAPVLLLLALLVVLGKTTDSPVLLWLALAVTTLISLAAAMYSGSVGAACATLVISLLVGAVWLGRMPKTLLSIGDFWLMAVGLGGLFFGVSLWLGSRIPRPADAATTAQPDSRPLLPGISAAFPFLLIYTVIGRLELADPLPVFAAMLVLALMLLGVVSRGWLPVLMLVAVVAVFVGEALWHADGFHRSSGAPAPVRLLGWYVGFALLFLVFPFVFHRRVGNLRLVWISAAIALPLHYPLVYALVKKAWPNDVMGLVPAAFAVPALLAVAAALKLPGLNEADRRHHLSVFGGVALLFITAIFPVQFDREWLTLAWALEGAALLWLFRRLGQGWLRSVAVGLFVLAFIRLAMNPAVLGYHERAQGIVFNWISYTYLIAIVAFGLGAWFARPPHHRWAGLSLRGWLAGMAVVLGFVMANLLVAHAFSPGARIEFDFSAALGRDMTYSLVWALYAAAILAAGFRWDLKVARYAGLGLLCVTIIKLFLHDLWALGGLYRIGSFVGLAVVLIGVSFVYQRFFVGANEEPDEPPPAPPEEPTQP